MKSTAIKNFWRLAGIFMMIVVMLAQQAIVDAAPAVTCDPTVFNCITQNDVSCTVAGDLGGTCAYDPNACTGPGSTSTAPAPTSNNSANGPTIVLDPGHSGDDIHDDDPQTGLYDHDYPNIPEISEVFSVAQNVQTKLTAAGYNVVMTKNSVNDDVSFRKRADIADAANAALAVSIHDSHDTSWDDMGGGDGGQVYTQNVGDYRQNKPGMGQGNQKVSFTDSMIAQKSNQYGKIFAEQRTTDEHHTVAVTHDSFDGRSDLPSGNIPMVQLFAKVPWVYNEVGAPSGALTQTELNEYAQGIVDGVEKSIPVTTASTGSPISSAPTAGASCCPTSGAGNTTSLGGPDGSGPLYGLQFPKVADTQDLANRIDKFIKATQPDSPFVGLGDKFVEAGIKYNVNPAMMIGFSVKEQSLGTAHDTEDDVNHNSFGISGNNPGQEHQYPVQNGATYYPSFEASIPEAADYIYAGYIKQGAPFYATTLLGLMEHYTPNEAGQSSQQQTQLTLDIEHKILDGISTAGGASSTNDSAGQSAASSSSSSCAGGSNGNGSTDCSTVTGDPKILCAAKAYNGIYYEWSGGHQGYKSFIAGCPDPSNPPNNQAHGGPVNGDPGGQSGNPSPCATDCSGLVSIAVDTAFGQNFMWSVVGSAMQGSGSQYWKSVPLNNVQPGDIVTTTEHVEIVDHYDSSSGTLYTFGSHQTGTKTSEVSAPLSSWSNAYRYNGPGS